MISRVTVLLPFVPEIETTGTRRSASRIHAGGVARAPAIRSVQRASEPLLGAGQPRACRDGETSRSARASAASVEGQRPLRTEPRERDDPVPGVGRAMDGDAAAALAVVDAQPPDPADDRRDRVGPVAGRDVRARGGRGRAAPGSRWPYQVRRRPMATSSLTTGSSR